MTGDSGGLTQHVTVNVCSVADCPIIKLTNRCWLTWLAIMECCHLATGVTSYPPDVIQQVENTLLSLFGHKKRPGRVSNHYYSNLISLNCQKCFRWTEAN